MFSFFKRKKIHFQVPEWASFFNEKEYNNFLSLLHDYFTRKGINYTMGDGEITVDKEVFGGMQLGLVNLAQNCKQSPPNEWASMISNQFDSLEHAERFNKEFRKKLHNFEAIKDFVGVRMYHRGYVEHIGGENTIYKIIADDVIALLVFDMPHIVTNIKPEETATWNKSTEELFAFAIGNTRQKYPPEMAQEKVGDFNMWFVAGDHFFSPNILLDLADHPALVGSKGSLVGVPHRHAVLIYPIENMEVVQALTTLIQIVYGMHQEGPGSITNQLYWYNNNEFHLLPYKLEGKTLQFTPPPNFIEILNDLESPRP